MKVCHWTLMNGSGMHRVAESMSLAEKASGIDSILVDSYQPTTWDMGVGDIHVVHSHFPDKMRHQYQKVVYIPHGTPEHIFQLSVEKGLQGQYAPPDALQTAFYWLKNADKIVTFWPRHQAIWDSLTDKNTEVRYIPLGIDKTFWHPVPSPGKYHGTPSLLTAENCHTIKWPLDLLIAWPRVTEYMPEAKLHLLYLPMDQHRWWFPLMFNNGSAFRSYVGGTYDHNSLRNIMCSVDYYIGLVRYGDFNRVSLEAKACGTKLISYWGNPYADYWIPEGDQRIIATKLTEILKGNAVPRGTEEVPDIKETAEAMIKIYKEVIRGSYTESAIAQINDPASIPGGNGDAGDSGAGVPETVQSEKS